MSQLAIRNALLGQAITTLTPLVGGNIVFENRDFDPTGLDAWCSTHFVPSTSESTGKSSASSDEQRGFFQISVYIKVNESTYDNSQLSIIDAVMQDFYFGVKIGVVDILEVTTNNGYQSESWFKRDITINYSSFTSRG